MPIQYLAVFPEYMYLDIICPFCLTQTTQTVGWNNIEGNYHKAYCEFCGKMDIPVKIPAPGEN